MVERVQEKIISRRNDNYDNYACQVKSTNMLMNILRRTIIMRSVSVSLCFILYYKEILMFRFLSVSWCKAMAVFGSKNRLIYFPISSILYSKEDEKLRNEKDLTFHY
jgi:hypothetical protein